MKKIISISLDEILVKKMDDLHIQKSNYINDVLWDSFQDKKHAIVGEQKVGEAWVDYFIESKVDTIDECLNTLQKSKTIEYRKLRKIVFAEVKSEATH